MAPIDAHEVEIPESYSNLPVEHIKVSNHPESAPGVTPVQIVTLNRPKQRNAFTARMTDDLILTYNTFDVDERVKCVVLTGAGDSFCAGADLQMGFAALGRAERMQDNRDTGGRVALAMFKCRKPIIAALNGSAAGVGMTMTLPAAIRVAHASSKYVFPFAARGIIMESASSYFLPRLIGFSDASYLLTTGEAQTGSSKFFRSLFHEVLEERPAVLTRALEIATSVAQKTSGVTSFLNRELMWRGPSSPEEAHLLESEIGFHIGRNSDIQEGVKSFFEKRNPSFEDTLEKDGPSIYPWWRQIDIGIARPKKARPKEKL